MRTLLDIEIEALDDTELLMANRRIVAKVANDVLATLTKVDENRLRKAQIDTLPELLLQIAEFERTRVP